MWINIFPDIKKKKVSHIQTATVLHCLILKEGDRTVVYTCKTFKEPWNFLERSNTSVRLIEKSITNPFFLAMLFFLTDILLSRFKQIKIIHKLFWSVSVLASETVSNWY